MSLSYLALCLFVFLAAYLVNIYYITVLYHRGLAHNAVTLSPFMKKLVILTGNWVTGLDPKGWTCMHRMHHRYSDTEKDPHSPWNQGVFGVLVGQLSAYEKTLVGLAKRDPAYTSFVQDLDFKINWLNYNRLWFLPYAVQIAATILIGYFFGYWLLGIAFYVGMMSHPIQGWMVNSFAHKYGYRNFDTPDKSVNNSLVAWLVVGEGLQNNHHMFPDSAKFAMRRFEPDFGYTLCVISEKLGLLEIGEATELSMQKSHALVGA